MRRRGTAVPTDTNDGLQLNGMLALSRKLRPSEHHSRERRATYWMDYGHALARVRRRDDAVPGAAAG